MKKRQIEFDIMRILACFCVIVIHAAICGQEQLYPTNSSGYQFIKLWGVVARWAVPVFVM